MYTICYSTVCMGYGAFLESKTSPIRHLPTKAIIFSPHLSIRARTVATTIGTCGLGGCMLVAHSDGDCILAVWSNPLSPLLIVLPFDVSLSPAHRNREPLPIFTFTYGHDDRALTFTTTWTPLLLIHLPSSASLMTLHCPHSS